MVAVTLERMPSEVPNLRSFITLWTLSLAPLIAHVVVGVPQQVYMTAKPPSALLRFVHLNPTSILWRYFAILDRRIRAKHWDPAVLATSNAIFWTDHGWDGAEHVLEEHQTFLLRSPESAHVQVLSGSFIQTLIVAFQGIQAILQFSNVASTSASGFLTPFSKLASIFQPLAVFGLFRLVVAFWLVDDFAFANTGDVSLLKLPPSASSSEASGDIREVPEQGQDSAIAVDEKKEPANTEQEVSMHHQHTTSRELSNPSGSSTTLPSQVAPLGRRTTDRVFEVYPISNWRGLLFRFAFLLGVLGIAGLATVYLYLATKSHTAISATSICMVTIYPFFTIITAIVFALNMFRDTSRSTIVPGLSSVWYQVYTCVLFGAFAVMFIIASLEQIQPPCDGSSTNCHNILTLGSAHMSFNASFDDGRPGVQGFLNVSHIMMTGLYGGSVAALNGSHNQTLGSMEVL